MSTWNIELRTRKEEVTVQRIIERIPKHAAGFPGMVIEDEQGRRHTLAALDFLSHEWEQIEEGTRIELTFREQIAGIRVIS